MRSRESDLTLAFAPKFQLAKSRFCKKDRDAAASSDVSLLRTLIEMSRYARRGATDDVGAVHGASVGFPAYCRPGYFTRWSYRCHIVPKFAWPMGGVAELVLSA